MNHREHTGQTEPPRHAGYEAHIQALRDREQDRWDWATTMADLTFLVPRGTQRMYAEALAEAQEATRERKRAEAER